MTPLTLITVIWLSTLVGLSLKDFFLLFMVSLLIDYPRLLAKVILLPLAEHFRETPELKSRAKISIIIPARNEEKTISACIESLLENKYPWKQIIVVDDGSTDNTLSNASRYKNRITLLIRTKSGMKAYALNYGLQAANGDIVVTVDADTIVAWDFLEKVAAYFNDPFILAGSGNLRVSNENVNLLTRLQSFEYVTAFDIGRRLQSMFNTLLIIPGAVGVIIKSILESIGGYDPLIGEDFDMTLKVHKVRGRVIFMPEAYAWTEVPESWRLWFKQRVRWHRSQIRMLVKHRNLFFRRIFGTPGLIGAPDMLLMDIIAIFLRPAWLLYFLVTSPNPLTVFGITFLFYLTMELQTALSVLSVVEDPRDMRHWYLFFIMSILYRPVYGLVRLYAYTTEIVKPSSEW